MEGSGICLDLAPYNLWRSRHPTCAGAQGAPRSQAPGPMGGWKGTSLLAFGKSPAASGMAMSPCPVSMAGGVPLAKIWVSRPLSRL